MRRREILKYAGLLAGGSQLPHTVEAQASEPTWPMFQFDAANTGYNPSASLPTEQIGEQWRTSTLGEVVASPVIADGMAFVGSRDGKVYAIDVEDGSKQWEYNIGEPIESTPVILDNRLFIGSSGGRVYSLSLNGSKNWDFQTAPSQSEEYTVLSDLATDGDYIYLLSGKKDGSWREGRIYCITPNNGREVWDYPLIDRAWPHTPAIHSGTLYTFGLGQEDNANGSVIALNTTDGTVEWSGGSSSGVGGITVDGNSVYVTTGTNTYALDASNGSTQWEYNFPELEDSWIYSSASIEGRKMYLSVTSGDDFGYIYELDTVTGERTSRVRLLDEIRSSPIISGDMLYIGTEGGTVHGISRTDFEERWSSSTGEPVRSTPALVRDSLYIGSNDGYIYSLGRADESTQTQTTREGNTETPTATSQSAITPTQATTQAPSSTSTVETTMTPTPTESDFERGFFTNGRQSSFEFLNNPFVLTVGGFFLSVFGIVYQLVEGD
jgi:outer membrane protein assembly factor BamB